MNPVINHYHHESIMVGYKDILKKRGNSDQVLIENCRLLDDVYFLHTIREENRCAENKFKAILALLGVEPWQANLISEDFLQWLGSTGEQILPKDLYSTYLKYELVTLTTCLFEYEMGYKKEFGSIAELEQLFKDIKP